MVADAADRDDPLAGIIGGITVSSVTPASTNTPAPKPVAATKTKKIPRATNSEPASQVAPDSDAIKKVSEAHGFVSREGKRDRRRGRKTRRTESRNIRMTPETDQRLDLLLDVLSSDSVTLTMGDVVDQATQLLLADCKKKGLIPDE